MAFQIDLQMTRCVFSRLIVSVIVEVTPLHAIWIEGIPPALSTQKLVFYLLPCKARGAKCKY